MIEYLLECGASVDTISASTWLEPSELIPGYTMDMMMLSNSGGQTALNVAQIWGDMELERFLISKSANQSIQPVNTERVEEYR